MTGKVARYFEDKGFGFIRPDPTEEQGKDVFVHVKAIKRGMEYMREGALVEFEIGKEPATGRPRAVRVTVMEKS